MRLRRPRFLRSPAHRRAGAAPEVVVLTSEGCTLCAKAVELIRIAAPRARVEEVDVHCPEGREIARRHRSALVPVIVVDGQLVSSGGFCDEDLLTALGS